MPRKLRVEYSGAIRFHRGRQGIFQLTGEGLLQVAPEHPEFAPEVGKTALRAKNLIAIDYLCRTLAAMGTNGVPYLIQLAPKSSAALKYLMFSAADPDVKTNILHQVDPAAWTNYTSQPLPPGPGPLIFLLPNP